MKLINILRSVFLLLSLGLPVAYAAPYNFPTLEENKFLLEKNNPVDIEIITGQIFEKVNYDKFTGYTYIAWADEAFTSAAEAIRQKLVKKGFSPEWVIMNRKKGGYDVQVKGVSITLQKIIPNRQECNYTSLNYHFNKNDDFGCALDNMRSLSIVNPYKYYF